ncbi:MAG TPA: methyltransferase domain-containing protein [Verrucomicrobiae bacterium]|nr:methyltransferase domain-containing protein [Verrucomicrobiae bacterium]
MWDNYRSTFPKRYITPGFFDEYLENCLRQRHPKTILDIGGGTEGTAALQEIGVPTYLLDPFVKGKPDWITEKVPWDTTLTFDAVVARGSINYLTKEELLRTQEMLNPGGTFIANTFLNPPPEEWGERPYQNSLGHTGIERSRYNPSTSSIEHVLIPSKGEPIEHSFFYYSPEEYRALFPRITLTTYKGNSVILTWTKP